MTKKKITMSNNSHTHDIFKNSLRNDSIDQINKS